MNIHPGEFLRREFMEPLRLTPEKMAKAIPRAPGFPESDIAETIRDFLRADEDASLDLNLALALDRYFGLSPGFFWLLQSAHEIKGGLASEATWLARIKPLKPQKKTRR